MSDITRNKRAALLLLKNKIADEKKEVADIIKALEAERDWLLEKQEKLNRYGARTLV